MPVVTGRTVSGTNSPDIKKGVAAPKAVSRTRSE